MFEGEWLGLLLISFLFVDSTKHVTGFQDIIKYLTNFWNEGNATCKPKCQYKKSTQQKIETKTTHSLLGMELLAQMVTLSQSSLDSPTSKDFFKLGQLNVKIK